MNTDNLKDTLDLRRYLRMIHRGRWFYAACVALAIVLAVTYAFISSPVYRNHTEIMIEEDNGGSGLSAMLGANSSMANLFALSGLGSSTIDDEMLLISSNRNYINVSRLLQLNRMYFEKKGLRKQMLVKNSPIRVEAPAEYFDTLDTRLKLTVELEGQGKISARLTSGFLNMTTLAEAKHEQLPYTLHSKCGDLLILATDFYTESPIEAGRTIIVNITSNQKIAYGLTKEISVEPVDKKSNAVRLSLKHAERQYAYDVLSAVTASYSDIRNEHKHYSSTRQVEFLDQRIELLLQELDTLQTDVKQFMNEKDVIDIQGQTAMLLTRTEELNAKIIEAETELQISQEILNLLRQAPDDYPTIAIGTESEPVKLYNELVLQRINLRHSAKDGNLMLETTESKLKELRSLIMDNMEQNVAQCRTQIKTLKGYQQQSAAQLGQVPDKSLDFVNLQQSFQLKNSLLLFLLQQRENALMDLKKNTDAGFVYEPPYTEKDKDYSKKILVALLLLFLSIAGPTFLLWCYMLKCDRLEDDSDLPVALRQHGSHSARDMRRLLMSQKGVETLYLQPLEGAEDMREELASMMRDVPGSCELKSEPQLDVLLADSDIQLDDSHLLVILVHGCTMKRKEFVQLLQGVDPAHVFVWVGPKGVNA